MGGAGRLGFLTRTQDDDRVGERQGFCERERPAAWPLDVDVGCTYPHSPVLVGALGTQPVRGFLGSGPPGTAPAGQCRPCREAGGRAGLSPGPSLRVDTILLTWCCPEQRVEVKLVGQGRLPASGRVGGASGWEAGALTAGALAARSPAHRPSPSRLRDPQRGRLLTAWGTHHLWGPRGGPGLGLLRDLVACLPW